jgi:ABC-type Zn uptake system ZnuABC Zn-binding protein ZnuA
MRKIASADVFVINGLGLEEYLGAPVERANAKVRILDSSKGIAGVLKMTAEEGAGDAHEHGQFNPHLFASPRMAAKVVRNIAAQLGEIDPAGAELYRRNADAYASRLEALADEFASAGKVLARRKVVSEHAVFDYLARDAGLEVVAVVEENPGQDPAAAQMLDIVSRIKASGAAAVFTEPQYSPKVAETIAKEAGVPVAELDPVASRREPGDTPLDYYETVMRRNLETLRKTLGPAR